MAEFEEVMEVQELAKKYIEDNIQIKYYPILEFLNWPDDKFCVGLQIEHFYSDFCRTSRFRMPSYKLDAVKKIIKTVSDISLEENVLEEIETARRQAATWLYVVKICASNYNLSTSYTSNWEKFNPLKSCVEKLMVSHILERENDSSDRCNYEGLSNLFRIYTRLESIAMCGGDFELESVGML